MDKYELLQDQLRFALVHNHDEKLTKHDFPGYWLFLIEEQLSKADKLGILSMLRVSLKMASIYKLTFAQWIAQMVNEVQP